MLLICGALVNGPYALITTAVSADLVSRATSGPGQGLYLQAHLPHVFPLPPACRDEILKVLQSPPWFPVSSQLQALIAPFPRPSPFLSRSPAQGAAS